MMVSGIFFQLCFGIFFIWSVFQSSAMEYFGWNSTQASLTFTIMMVANATGVFFGGKSNDKKGSRWTAFAGLGLFGVGLLASSFVPRSLPWLVYIFYSGLGGFGGGCGYVAVVSCVQKWWPHKKGFGSGVMVSAFQLSTVVFSPLISYWLSDGDLSLPDTFRALAIIFLSITVIFGWFIKDPPKAECREESGAGLPDVKQYSPCEVLKVKNYYLICLALNFITPLFFMLNPVFETFGELRGLSEAAAVFSVMCIGIASSLGSLIAAKISDRIGRKKTLSILYVMNMAAILLLIAARGNLYFIMIFVISMTQGGSGGLMPVVASDYFGMKNMGANFSLFAIASLLIGLAFSYTANVIGMDGMPTLITFIISAVACALGMLATRLLKD